MKISVFYDHILQACEQSGEELRDMLQHVKNCGIDAVEINLTYLVKNPETLEFLSKAGLEVSCIYEFYQMEKAGLIDRFRWKAKARKHVQTALKAGAERILVVPGFLTENEAEEVAKVKDSPKELAAYFDGNESMQRMLEGMAYIVQRAKEQTERVIVTVEDFDDRKSPLCTMNGVKYTLDRVPGLKHTFDMGNYAYAGEEVTIAWELLHDSVAHVHCKDRGNDGKGNRLLSVATGAGYLPIGLLVQNLAIQKYEGYLAIEHFDASNQKETIKRSAEYLKKCAIF